MEAAPGTFSSRVQQLLRPQAAEQASWEARLFFFSQSRPASMDLSHSAVARSGVIYTAGSPCSGVYATTYDYAYHSARAVIDAISATDTKGRMR